MPQDLWIEQNPWPPLHLLDRIRFDAEPALSIVGLEQKKAEPLPKAGDEPSLLHRLFQEIIAEIASVQQSIGRRLFQKSGCPLHPLSFVGPGGKFRCEL